MNNAGSPSSAPSAPPGAVVVGGTGFVGSRAVRALAAHGHDVATGTRSPETAGDVPRPVRTDLSDRASLEAAFEGARAVVNCVGLYVERGGATFRSVHVEGAGRVAEAARAQGVDRLVHISGIGADPEARSAYIRARGEGEQAVRGAFPGATILRPSAMFADGEGLFAALAPIVRMLPVVPLFGDGSTRLQPVHVEDTGEAVARALEAPDATGTIYELGGAESLTYREIVERVAAREGRRRLLLPVPFALWRLIARAAGVLPEPPLTPAQVALMERDNVPASDMPGFHALGIEPRGPAAVGLA